jgi:hypothetical protein
MNGQTYRQKDKHSWQTDREKGRQSERKVDREKGRPTERKTDR